MRYELLDDKLYRDNHGLYCPFVSIGVLRLCGGWCPHFDMLERETHFDVRLYCVPTVRVIVIEKGSPE